MPIKIIEGLPVRKHLKEEQVYTIEHARAIKQDIRPLRILIVNLMPNKEATELHLLRLLGNTALQIDVDFLYTKTHTSQHTSTSYLRQFYKHFAEVQEEYYDGMIVTGAPVEHLEYQAIDYIKELDDIMRWSQTHVYSRLFICWAALYALNYDHKIDRIRLENKLFGVFDYQTIQADHPYLRGFDDTYAVPQSRHVSVDWDTIKQRSEIRVLTAHETFGPDILTTSDQRDLYALGHLEYDRQTLKQEYDRDISRGLEQAIPNGYYPEDDPEKQPINSWKSHGYLLYNNWLNETYQHTLYDLSGLAQLDRKL
ncbi:homoserine O-succinyltransferase [Fundicoccus sp. Sow4_D5]|uniref:homoserine O-succinyltransferase n=1 Tax=unclassified Fundicoccus TaxID=2761543 RepID=UPI003F90D8BE